jgi:hypothetical protein
MSDHAPKRDEARERAAEKSLRPDIQGGALRMAEGDEHRTSTSIHPCARPPTTTTRRDGCTADVMVEASW